MARLPAAHFATGSAVGSCARQIGAVLGIAVLIAILDHASPADPLGAFTDTYRLEALTALVAAGLALALGRVRVRAPIATPTTEAVT